MSSFIYDRIHKKATLPEDDPEIFIINKIFVDQLLESLTTEERDYIELWLEGYNFKDIAKIKGLIPQTLAAKVAKIMKKLRKNINEEDLY